MARRTAEGKRNSDEAGPPGRSSLHHDAVL